VTARCLLFDLGGETLVGEILRRPDDFVSGKDFDAEVIDCAGSVEVLEEHELQWWLGDGEVGVARTDLRRFGLEELGVERHRFVEVRHLRASCSRDTVTP